MSFGSYNIAEINNLKYSGVRKKNGGVSPMEMIFLRYGLEEKHGLAMIIQHIDVRIHTILILHTKKLCIQIL